MERVIYLIVFLLLSLAGIMIVRPDIPLRESVQRSADRKTKIYFAT